MSAGRMEGEETERCTLLSEQLNACLLGVRNWVCNLCHSGVCFRKVECSCRCIMKSIHTFLLNDGLLHLHFKYSEVCGCTLVDSRYHRSVYGEVKQDGRFGGLRGVIWLHCVRYRLSNTWQNTMRVQLAQKQKTAHFWEEHTLRVCFTFWQTLLH